MSKNLNFTQPSNDQECSCSKHHGVGEWSPAKRAAVYARQRDRLKNYYFPHMKAYLETYEAAHGAVTYDLEEAQDRKTKEYFTIAVPTMMDRYQQPKMIYSE